MTKWAARGTVLSFEGTPVGQVRSIGPIGSKRNLIEASVYGEDDMDYVLGLKDGNEVSIVIAYDDADTGHGSIDTSFNESPDDVTTWNVTNADSGLNRDFSARITGVDFDVPLDGLQAMNVTLKIVAPGVTEGT